MLGEGTEVELCDGSRATVKLLDLKETRDTVRGAVRKAAVTVQVNDQRTELVAATYHLPTTIAGVRIDCAVTKGYTEGSSQKNVWGLLKDARLRLWPANSPLIDPATFSYPIKLKWFASDTQMANVPVFVDGGEPEFGGCAFIKNWSDGEGGGLRVNAGGCRLINCTIYGNRSNFEGGGLRANKGTSITLKNSIFWANVNHRKPLYCHPPVTHLARHSSSLDHS